jgi:hypothetical protein
MLRRCSLILLTVLSVANPIPLRAQDVDNPPQDSRRSAGHHALNLGISGVGLSIGNSRRWAGLRINWQDNAVDRVDGINVTLWNAKHNEDMEVNGLALGVAGPVGGRFNGVTIGLVGAVAERGFNGITLAGIGAVSNGDMQWVNISGLGTVANRSMRGLTLAGLGVVANGEMQGINISGLGTVANGNLWGLNLGGLAVVGNGSVRGISAGGLAVVSNGDMTGIGVGGLAVVGNGAVRGISVGGLAVVSNGPVEGVHVGGLAVVANGRMTGLAVGGLAVVGDEGLVGVAVGGLHVEGRWIHGLAISPIRTRTWEMRGVSIAGYNRMKGDQFGLAIGLYNYAKRLHGVQLGLINNARNNKGLLRVLPIINVHLH